MSLTPARPRALIASTAAGAALLLTAGTAHAELSAPELQRVTDEFLFVDSLSDFTEAKAEKPYGDQLDWSSDSCSYSPDKPFGYDFSTSCDRHDFGYRNYQAQQRFSEDNRHRIDDNFKEDMYEGCADDAGCKSAANVYYWAVRQFGNVGAGQAAEHAQITPQHGQHGEIIGYTARDPLGKLVHFDA